MANIRADVNYTIKDGSEIVFRSPVDCTEVTGLRVYYLGDDGVTTSQDFVLADAHGENVGDIPNLFAENVVVKVILDVTTGMAFVQNADTNAYLEGRFEELEKGKAPVSHTNDTNNPHSVTAEQVGAAPAGYGLGYSAIISASDLDSTKAPGWYCIPEGITHNNVSANYWYMHVVAYGSGNQHCVQKLYPVSSYNVELVRFCRSSTWSAWECANPPLALGVEYRTTERWAGNPVYVTLVNFGAMPDSSTKEKTHGIANIYQVIRVECSVFHSTATFNLPYDAGTEKGMAYANKTAVKITANATLGTYGYSAYVAVYYTKTT